MNGCQLIEILKKNPEDTVYFATQNKNPKSGQEFEVAPKRKIILIPVNNVIVA